MLVSGEKKNAGTDIRQQCSVMADTGWCSTPNHVPFSFHFLYLGRGSEYHQPVSLSNRTNKAVRYWSARHKRNTEIRQRYPLSGEKHKCRQYCTSGNILTPNALRSTAPLVAGSDWRLPSSESLMPRKLSRRVLILFVAASTMPHGCGTARNVSAARIVVRSLGPYLRCDL